MKKSVDKSMSSPIIFDLCITWDLCSETSEAAGVEKIYLVGITGTPPRKEIKKTAIGAENNVPWEYHADILPLLKYLKTQSIPIVVLEHTDSSKDFQKVNYDFPLCLIIGNEVDGISEEVMDYADIAVEIPMFGMKQSLNVSVAYGIMLFELIRQLEKYVESLKC